MLESTEGPVRVQDPRAGADLRGHPVDPCVLEESEIPIDLAFGLSPASEKP